MLVMVAQDAKVYDGGIAEGPVAVLDGGAADENGVGKGFLDGARSDVEDQVLVAGLLKLGDGVVQLGEVRLPLTPRTRPAAFAMALMSA